jgi:hypothetical protein
MVLLWRWNRIYYHLALALKTQISNPTFEEFEILLALPDIFP